MIWKIVSALFGIGILFFLVFWYVPDLRGWLKGKVADNAALTDTLKIERDRRLKAEASLSVNSASFERINRDLERSTRS